MKVIIAGGRDFNNYDFLKEKCLSILQNETHIEIISGGAKGADKLGEKFADEMECEKFIFPANWDEHGRKAGHLRNEKMADFADALIAFWDGTSKGTANMIKNAKKKKLKIRIIKYVNE